MKSTLEDILERKAHSFADYAKRIRNYLEAPVDERPPIHKFAEDLKIELTKDRNTVDYVAMETAPDEGGDGEESGEERPAAE